MAETDDSTPRQSIGAGLAVAALTAAAFFWSGNFVAGRALGGRVDPLALNAIRWIIATALYLPLAAGALRREHRRLRRHWGLVAALGLTGIAFFHVFTYAALVRVPVTNAVLLLAFCPLLILAGSVLTGHAEFARRDLAAILLSVAGVAVILSEGRFAQLAQFRFAAGDLWMILAVLAWTVYTLLLRAVPRGLEPRSVLAASMVVGTAAMIPLALVFGHLEPQAFDAAVWGAILYIAVFASVLAYVFWAAGVRRLGPEASGLFLNLMPVFGALLAWAILGEPLLPYQVAGAAAILAAIILSKPMTARRKPDRSSV